jgi:hypothetical protein
MDFCFNHSTFHCSSIYLGSIRGHRCTNTNPHGFLLVDIFIDWVQIEVCKFVEIAIWFLHMCDIIESGIRFQMDF